MRPLLLAAFLSSALFGQIAPRNSPAPSHLQLFPSFTNSQAPATPHFQLIPSFTKPKAAALPAPKLAIKRPAVAAPRPCAIPLLKVVPDSNIDPGIFVRSQPWAGSRMPQIVPPALSCDEGATPEHR